MLKEESTRNLIYELPSKVQISKNALQEILELSAKDTIQYQVANETLNKLNGGNN